MGYFDLPSGEFELLMKKKGKGRFKSEWKTVMFTDSLYPSEIADTVEMWSENYVVMSARFNGRKVLIPDNYHWEHRLGDKILGSYTKRAEAKKALEERKHLNFRKSKEERVRVGTIKFVKD